MLCQLCGASLRMNNKRQQIPHGPQAKSGYRNKWHRGNEWKKVQVTGNKDKRNWELGIW